jgi:N-acetyl-gamma-glutamyl-phosphate/LysW-gamma-L-alpha-aminoadipyl-6-phosphate reductase
VTRVSVVGASGYIGGELLRLLLGHPEVSIGQVTSERMRGRRVDGAHPNLRALTDLRFVAVADLCDADVLMFATPHRVTMNLLPSLAGSAPLLIDLSGDFRLADAGEYQRYYGVPHAAPELLARFVPGCPELARKELAGARWISVPGCMATAAILALAPLADAGMIEREVQISALTGSSGGGRGDSIASSHPERHGAMRAFAPVSHRHEAEVRRHTGLAARMTATGVEAVRGVQVVCHARARAAVSEPQARAVYRERYAAEPFVRVVAHRRGIHRYPDPKVLLGSNFCDVGFALSAGGDRLAIMGALDNLVKGGAGAAVQCLNIRMGWPERAGLEFAGLHPL